MKQTCELLKLKPVVLLGLLDRMVVQMRTITIIVSAAAILISCIVAHYGSNVALIIGCIALIAVACTAWVEGRAPAEVAEPIKIDVEILPAATNKPTDWKLQFTVTAPRSTFVFCCLPYEYGLTQWNNLANTIDAVLVRDETGIVQFKDGGDDYYSFEIQHEHTEVRFSVERREVSGQLRAVLDDAVRRGLPFSGP